LLEAEEHFDLADAPDEDPATAVGISDLTEAGAGETLPSLMARLQLEDSPPGAIPRNILCSASLIPLARFHKIWNRALKMTCKRHANCSLMVEPWWFEDPEAVLYRWVSLSKFVGEDEHYAESRRLARVGAANAKAKPRSL